MARRFCPVCGTAVEEKIIKEKDERGRDVVTKVCPNCGFIFVKYKVGVGVLMFMNEPTIDGVR